MVAPADPETADVNPREGWPLTYWAKVAVVVTLVVGGLLILRRASDVFVLILTAAVLAVGLDPSVRWLERRGLGRGTAVGVIVLLGLLGLAAFLWFVIPEFVDQAKAFAGDLPQLLKRLSARDDWIGRFIGNADLQRHFQDVVENAPSDVANSFGSVVGVTSRITGLVFRLLTIGVLTVYFMLTYPAARRVVVSRVRERERERLDRFFGTVTRRIGGYVSGKFVLSGLSAIVAGIVLVLLGVQLWLPLAVWAGIAGLIPIVGAYLGAAPAVLIALSDSTGTALIVLLFFVVWQQVYDYVLSPRIMKDAVDLSPAVVMVTTIIGGSIGGLFGILLALPVAAAIKALADEYAFPADPMEPVVPGAKLAGG